MILRLPSRTLQALLAARWNWQSKDGYLLGPGPGELSLSVPGSGAWSRSLRIPSAFPIEVAAEVATWYVGEEDRDYRRAQSEDLDQILAFLHSGQEEQEKLVQREELIRRLLAEEILFVATLRQEIWSFCGLGSSGCLFPFRSQGLRADTFLQLQLLSLAADSGIAEVWGVDFDNQSAQWLFQQIGFSPAEPKTFDGITACWRLLLQEWRP